MTKPVRIIGSYVSPYVRKVLVFLTMKGIAYEIDPIVPFSGDERFTRLSPLRRVPVYVDEDVTLADSSVICQYLEDRHPEPALYPRDLADRARARWIEEFADTRMGDVFVWRLFHQRILRPFVLGEKTDRELLERNLAEDVPAVLAYLESLAPAEGFFFGAPSIADFSVASLLRTASFARFELDAARWPRTAGLVARTLETEGFRHVRPYEELQIRTPPAEHREALAAAGAPVTSETLGTSTMQRGVMPID